MAGTQSSIKMKETEVRSIAPSRVNTGEDQTTKDAQLLIVDCDPQICEFIQEEISAWGMKAKSISNPLKVLDKLRHSFYNLVLLDTILPETSGIDLIPQILDLCPDTKIIMMTTPAERDVAIKGLEVGAFDLLEKPFTPALLSHCLNRALDTQKTEWEYEKADDDLKRTSDDLSAHKSRLEQLNRQLMETNNALSVLAQNIERTRQETEKTIVLKIRALILPIIEKLQQDQHLARYHAELTMLFAHMKDLTSGLVTDTKILSALTATELRIASLIKNGLTSEEIATYLYISPDTVKTHRKNIRKKLKINNSMYNLRNYLGSKLGDGIDHISMP